MVETEPVVTVFIRDEQPFEIYEPQFHTVTDRLTTCHQELCVNYPGMASKDYGPSHIPSASQLEESGYSGSHSSPAMPRSMKEAGKHFANLMHQVEKLLKERDHFYAQIE